MPQTGSLAMLDHPPSAPGSAGTVQRFIVTRDRLPRLCLNHRLRVEQQVLGVLLENVLAGLRMQLADKGLKQVDRDPRLATIERCLGRVELGDQAAGYTRVVDMPVIRRMLDACPEGRNGWCVGTIIHWLRTCRCRNDQSKDNQGQCEKQESHGQPPLLGVSSF